MDNLDKIENLETRVEVLQNLLLPQDKETVLNQQTTLIQDLNALSQKIQKLEQNNPEIQTFLQKFSNIEKVLTSLEEFQLNAENKYSIIMSTENEIKETIQNLEIIQTHEKYINSENFQKVPFLFKTLTPLETTYLQLQQESNDVQTRVEALLDHYNSLILLLSEKFTYWNELLNHFDSVIQESEATF